MKKINFAPFHRSQKVAPEADPACEDDAILVVAITVLTRSTPQADRERALLGLVEAMSSLRAFTAERCVFAAIAAMLEELATGLGGACRAYLDGYKSGATKGQLDVLLDQYKVAGEPMQALKAWVIERG